MHLMDRIKIAGVDTKVSVIHMDAPESTPLTTYENFFKGSGVSVVSGGVIDLGGNHRSRESDKAGGADCLPSPLGVDSQFIRFS